jgi:hypothetical protein
MYSACCRPRERALLPLWCLGRLSLHRCFDGADLRGVVALGCSLSRSSFQDSRSDRRRRGGQCYFELGSPLLSHASPRCSADRSPDESHTNKWWAAAKEGVLSNTWTESGQTSILCQVSK